MAKIRRRAKRDVRVAYAPQFHALDRAGQQIRQETRSDRKRIGNIYDALGQNLAPIGTQYQNQAQGIATGLQDQLGSLASMLGMSPQVQGMAPGEAQAAAGAFGGIGAGALANLAGDRSRQAAWQGSTERQAALERMTAHRNLLEDKRQLLDDVMNQRLDLTGEMGPQILSRIDELRSIRKQNQLAEKEYELRKHLAYKDRATEQHRYNQEKAEEKDAAEYTRSQAEIERDSKRIKPIRQDIESLLDQVKAIEKAQEDVGRPNAELQAKENRIKRRVKKKRKKIRRIKRTDSYA